MDQSKLSPEVCFLMQYGQPVVFKRFRRNGEELPSAEQCKGELTGITLTYAFCGEQDDGIRPLLKAFGALNDDLLIKREPLEVVELDGYKAIKYGEDVHLDFNVARTAKQSGVVGYWDKSNLMICTSPEYGFLIESIKELMKPRHARFGFKGVFGGRYHLVILST